MAGNRKRKKELPITGILVAVVIVLVICAGVMAMFVQRQDSRQKEQQSGAQEETIKNGSKERESDASQELESGESETDKTGEKTDAETDGITGSTADSEEYDKETAKNDGEESESESGETETEETTESETEEKLVVAIDPGHQGSWVDMSDTEPNGPGSSEMKTKSSTGTQGSYSQKTEYELNLEISLQLREELEARGYEVILTREDNDTAISNAERALLAYEQGGDIYVRIHANGSEDSSVSGALAMVPSSGNPYVGELAEDSYLLADCILNAYCSKASFQSLGIQYYDNMTGISWSRLPVMILEMGFMTNESDDLRMADASVQKLMVEGIADGIEEYFIQKGMKKKTVSPEAVSQMNALLETLGEDLIYPAMEQGEDWAVSLVDLTTGAEGDISGDQPMKSASVIKVFIMAAIYDRVCYPASEERHISFQEAYDGELKQLITDMITVSDNNAANTLLERLGSGDAKAGMAIVNQYCEENGYTATTMGRKFLEENPEGDNYTSANDCRRLLESIYNGTCVGAEASAKMYEYLKQQTRVNKIPAGLASTAAAVANKTGELAGEYGDYVENDIAVIENGDRAYVLCVMSQNLNDNGSAIERIATISERVYEALQ